MYSRQYMPWTASVVRCHGKAKLLRLFAVGHDTHAGRQCPEATASSAGIILAASFQPNGATPARGARRACRSKARNRGDDRVKDASGWKNKEGQREVRKSRKEGHEHASEGLV